MCVAKHPVIGPSILVFGKKRVVRVNPMSVGARSRGGSEGMRLIEDERFVPSGILSGGRPT